jgi:membrane-associated phospholipid phosphatase
MPKRRRQPLVASASRPCAGSDGLHGRDAHATERFVARLRSHRRLKHWIGTLLTIVFCAGYFALQRWPLRPVQTLELTWIDRAIAFSPGWVWVYQSVYLLLTSAWLARTRDQLHRYAAGFLFVTMIGFAFFLAWPIAAPRPADAPRTGMFGLLLAYDGLVNCFPSLHVALATYAACFAAHVLDRRPRWVVAVLAAWVALICYATLATKQHYFVDVPAGLLLGWLGHVSAERLRASAGASWLGRLARALRQSRSTMALGRDARATREAA